jgi:hypothetical protein
MAFIYNLTDSWTDAATTWNGIKLAVTNSGADSSSKLLNLTVTGASTASFVVDKSGNLVLNGTVNKITMTAPATGATLTLADGSTFATSGAYSSTFTFSGTTTLTFPTSGTVTALGNTTTGSGSIVLATGPSITLTNATDLPLATGVTGTLPIANGGTGQTTANAAFNALAPSQGGNSGKYLTTDGSNTSWATNPLGTVTSVDVSGGSTGLSFSGGPITTSGTITMAGTLAAANGGTGLTSLGTGIATWLGTPSSANLAAAVTDETGSGPLVFATSPTFTSQVTFGTASSTRGTLVLANTSANTVTLQSSNSTAANYTLTFPAAAPVNGYYLQTDTNGVLSWAAGGGGGGGSPGGSTTQVQYNNAGAFGGMPGFTFDGTATVSLGVASTTSGSLKLYNSASADSVSLASGNNSAAWTLTLPTSGGTNNYALLTDGSGTTSWGAVATGTISTGTIGQITYYSGTNALSGTTTGTGVLTALGNNTNEAGGVLVPAAALTASAIVLGGGSGTGPATTTTGTGVVTALGVNTGSAGAFVVNGGALGTPSSGTLSSCTGLSLTTGVSGILPVANGGTNASSAGITAFNNITGYTATGATGTTSTNLVFSTSPTLVTPTLGVASATSINKVAITAPATSATLTIADGKTLTASNTLTFAGTDSTTMTFPATSSTVLTTGNTATITKGYTVTPNNIGTVSSGTTTPDPANGNYQYYTNNGAHTLAAPSSDCAIDILLTNGASAGAITFSGFTVGSSTGSTYATTNTQKYLLSIRRINGTSTYIWYALQ